MRSYQLVVQWSAADSTSSRISSAASIQDSSKKNRWRRLAMALGRKQGSPDLTIRATMFSMCWWYRLASRKPLMTRVRYSWKGSESMDPPMMLIISSVSLKAALSKRRLLAGEISRMKPKSMWTSQPCSLSSMMLPLWRSLTWRRQETTEQAACERMKFSRADWNTVLCSAPKLFRKNQYKDSSLVLPMESLETQLGTTSMMPPMSRPGPVRFDSVRQGNSRSPSSCLSNISTNRRITCSARQSCRMSSNTLKMQEISRSSGLRLGLKSEKAEWPERDMEGEEGWGWVSLLPIRDIERIGWATSSCGKSSSDSEVNLVIRRWAFRSAKQASGPEQGWQEKVRRKGHLAADWRGVPESCLMAMTWQLVLKGRQAERGTLILSASSLMMSRLSAGAMAGFILPEMAVTCSQKSLTSSKKAFSSLLNWLRVPLMTTFDSRCRPSKCFTVASGLGVLLWGSCSCLLSTCASQINWWAKQALFRAYSSRKWSTIRPEASVRAWKIWGRQNKIWSASSWASTLLTYLCRAGCTSYSQERYWSRMGMWGGFQQLSSLSCWGLARWASTQRGRKEGQSQMGLAARSSLSWRRRA